MSRFHRFLVAALPALAALAVAAPPLAAQGPGDECVTAFSASDGLNPFDTTSMTNSADFYDPSQCPGTFLGQMSRDLWFAYVSSFSGPVVLSTCSFTTFDTDLVVYTGSCGALAQVACNGDGPAPACPGFTSRLTMNAVVGTQYWIRVGGYDPVAFGTGALEILPSPAAPGDECAMAIPVVEGVIPFDTTFYTDSADPYDDTQCIGTFLGAMARDGWWQFTPTTSGDLTVSLCGLSTLDSDLVIYEGACGALAQIACNGDSCALVSEATAPVSAGTTYTIRIGSWSPTSLGAVGQFSIAVVPGPAVLFKRGDIDGDGCVNALLDVMHLSGNLFPLGPPTVLNCVEAADTNGDGLLNIADMVYLIGWGFPATGVPNPIPAPGPDVCGPGPGPGTNCASYTCIPCSGGPPSPDVTLTALAAGPPGPSIPVAVLLDSNVPTNGFTFGVCHGAGIEPQAIDPGPALALLSGGGADVFLTETTPGQGWSVGIVVNLFNSESIPPSTGASIVIATYSCAGGAPSSIDFCSSLGNPPVPLTASIFGAGGVTPTTVGTTISCGPPPAGSFIRGDVSGDGVHDQTDALILEQFLYPGVLPFGPPPEPLGCDLVPNQSGDVNDNEVETIADLLMFKHYLDCGAISIPGPSSLCGDDVDDDTLGFDVIDDDYLLSAFTISVTGDVDEERDVAVLLQVKSPTSIKALALSLVIGSGLSLAPTPLTVAGGVAADFYGTLVDGTLVSVAAGSTTCGTPMMPSTGLAFAPIATLHLKLAPFATFPPCQLVQEATVLGHVRRTTVVDELYQDHQPLFLSGSGVIFARGNANNLDFDVNIADAIWVLGHLFPQPVSLPLDCVDAADANNDGLVNIADPIFLLGFLFSSGPIIPYPYPECGYDIDIDGIDIAFPGTQCETPICP